MILIIDLQYFAPVYVYKTLFQSTHVIFNAYDPHKKMSFRNRAVIAGANGLINLSIPLIGGREQKLLATQVRIDNSKNWQSQHWKSLQSAYNKSPWFDHYKKELEQLFHDKREFLIDWNLCCFDWIKSKLDLQVQESIAVEPTRVKEGAVDLTNQVLPSNYRHFDCPRYYQVFSDKNGFIANLSILDLLFCEGNHAKALLSEYQRPDSH